MILSKIWKQHLRESNRNQEYEIRNRESKTQVRQFYQSGTAGLFCRKLLQAVNSLCNNEHDRIKEVLYFADMHIQQPDSYQKAQ